MFSKNNFKILKRYYMTYIYNFALANDSKPPKSARTQHQTSIGDAQRVIYHFTKFHGKVSNADTVFT